MRWLCLFVLAFFMFGCATARDRAVMSMNGVAQFADGAQDVIEDN